MQLRLPLLSIPIAVACALACAPGSDAGPRTALGSLPVTFGDPLVIPPEWSGIWSTVDSATSANGTLVCSGPLSYVDTGLDTLCAGKELDLDDLPPGMICTGGADANIVDLQCSYTEQVDAECSVTFTMELVGTRTGDSYAVTLTTTTDFEGTSKECQFFQDSCERTLTIGTRIAPEPAAYCATPVSPTTWGWVKSQYR